ncbi:hypothetical protein [Actinorugispora endophytica]|uniref:Uncharacterized protein n=1 Tax=Actinorugispora endophytica TaxID=1605990 RepID=A0A4V3D8W8_9ACTN|nr:hypothetical protein [Actinorugispora endophytica]TDQ53469.1 hypothetical protein EV190_104259 [Actinorugispora endophytica]
MGSLWNQVKFISKLVSALLTFVAGVALAGHQAGLWTFSSGWRFNAAAVGVTLVFLASVASAVRQWRAEAAERTLRYVRQGTGHALNALLFRVQDETGIDMRDLGATAYVVTRTGVWPRRRERLEPVARVRFRSVNACCVDWRPGVGVVGRCVALARLLVVDVGDLDRQLEGVTATEWEELKQMEKEDGQEHELTQGMSHDEWRQARGKFSVVLATPLVRRSRTGTTVEGCVSVDVMAPDPFPDTYDLLCGEAVRHAAAAAAREIGSVLAAASG